jgi:hypothetical protein
VLFDKELLHKLKKVLWCYDPDIVKQARWPGDKIPLLPVGERKIFDGRNHVSAKTGGSRPIYLYNF